MILKTISPVPGGYRAEVLQSGALVRYSDPYPTVTAAERLALDASGVDNASSFEDWCAEYGYDTDSRKAERTYKVCERQAANLKRFLGSTAAYETLLFKTESL